MPAARQCRTTRFASVAHGSSHGWHRPRRHALTLRQAVRSIRAVSEFGEIPTMKRAIRALAIGLALLVAIAAGAVWTAYAAVRRVDPFYVDLVEVPNAEWLTASRELETQAGALYSNTQQEGKWSALFTAEQINGWLAVQLPAAYPDLLPPTVRDPRVAISPEGVTLGFRTNHAGIETVVTVEADVFLTKSSEVGMRLNQVRAGAMPLPAGQIAEGLRTSLAGSKLPIRWLQTGGANVALIDVHVATANSDSLVVHTLEMMEGEVYVAGRSEPPAAETPRVAQAAGDQVSSQ